MQDNKGGKRFVCDSPTGCRNAIGVFILTDPKADHASDWKTTNGGTADTHA